MGNFSIGIFPRWRGDCPCVPLFAPKAYYNPGMTIVMPGTTQILSLSIALLSMLWLGVCAIYDTHTHRVPNWLTLPAIPLALLVAWLTRGSRAETLFEFVFRLFLVILPLFVAWRNHLLGGADLKILVVLALASPLLVVAAWVGVMLYFFALLILHRARPIRFAGVPGFALGTGLFVLGQAAILFVQHLPA